MAQFYTLLTDVGQAKLANAVALGQTIEITELAVGDGGGSLPTPDSGATALINEVRRAPINTSTTDPDNPSWIVVEQVLPPDVGGWTIREIGIFDVDGDLIGIGNYPETYKPVLAEGSSRTQTVRFVLEVSDTAAVTLKVDPSVVLATREYVDQERAEHEDSRNHPAATETEQGMARIATQAETDTGADDGKFVTPKKLNGQLASTEDAQALSSLKKLLTPGGLDAAFKGGNQSLSSPGYQILPGGLIIQWGEGSGSSGGENTLQMPIAFPNQFLFGIAVDLGRNTTLATYGSWDIAKSTLSEFVGYWSSSPSDWGFLAIGY